MSLGPVGVKIILLLRRANTNNTLVYSLPDIQRVCCGSARIFPHVGTGSQFVIAHSLRLQDGNVGELPLCHDFDFN